MKKHSKKNSSNQCKMQTQSIKGIKGKIVGNPKGFAFLVQENIGEDIFIPSSALNGAIDGDEVIVQVYKAEEGKRKEGRVLEVLNHTLKTIVGSIQVFKGFSFVVPDNKKISKDVFIKKDKILNAVYGDKVVVKITKYDSKNLEGEVVEVLGPNNGNALVDVLSIVRSYNLIEDFPSQVIEEAKKVALLPIHNVIKNRLDLRDKLCITIDGDDSKDFDDAVSLEIIDGNFVLGVHIADVGEYVKLGSELDKEAFKRGTSVYFPNLVLPMLPKQLSNGICSLNEKEDRLTLSCIMTFDSTGKRIKYDFAESVISSSNRMTYGNVTKILLDDDELIKKYSHLVPMLKNMEKLCLVLEQKRKERGAIDFDIPEPKVILDDKLEVKDIVKRPRTISERIIESFMLSANETVAEHFQKRKIPFVYRVHEAPDSDKIKAFNDFVESMNLELTGVDLSPKDIQSFMKKIENHNMKEVINKVLLRAMQKAKYSSDCLGHFGLAAPYYCHFTSPIRRYPDLTIHRIIKSYLRKTLDEKQMVKLKSFVVSSSNQSSITEVNAEKTERDVDDYFKARYMKSNIGKVYEGKISGITNFGVFTELDNTIEGLTPIEKLYGDRYIFNEKQMTLTNGIKTYRFGDAVKVKVINVNLAERRVYFEIV